MKPTLSHQELAKKKRAHWQRHITNWKTSQLNASNYCREHKLNHDQFKYWQYQLAPETKKSPAKQATTFCEVEMANDATLIEKRPWLSDYFEVYIDKNLILRIPLTVESQQLKTLLTCLDVQ